MATTTRRQKGEGAFYKLPNGKYRMVITVGKGIDGKQIRKCVTANSKQELMEKVATVRLDKTPKIATQITFGELFAEYKRECFRDKAPSTKSAYGVLWRRIENELGKVRLDRITPQYMSSLILSMQNKYGDKELASSTLVLYRRLFSAIFNFAISKEYISKNPCLGILKGIRETKRADLQVIDEASLKRLLQDAKAHDEAKPYEPHWFPIILFAAASGMRRGEIMGLKKSAVNMETGVVDVRMQVYNNIPDLPLKNKHSYRQIRIDRNVLRIVMEDSDPESEYVFANHRTHKHWSMNTINASFIIFMRNYNNRPFPTFTLHNLRHYHATKLITAGIDIKAVSRRLGHSTVQTTLERYAHWLPETDEAAKSIVGSNLLF